MKNQHNTEINTVKKASIMGVVEDILHVSQEDEGYDLRVSNSIGDKQKIDHDQNA